MLFDNRTKKYGSDYFCIFKYVAFADAYGPLLNHYAKKFFSLDVRLNNQIVKAGVDAFCYCTHDYCRIHCVCVFT